MAESNEIKANWLEYLGLFSLQCLIPAVFLAATPKGSRWRYVPIAGMIWITKHCMHPVSDRRVFWACGVSILVMMVFQAIQFLLIEPLDISDVSRVRGEDAEGFGARVYQAFKLFLQHRHINTPWQTRNVPSHPEYYRRRGMPTPSRGRFLLRQTLTFAWQYLAVDMFGTVGRQQVEKKGRSSGEFSPLEWSVSAEKWVERAITNIITWFIVARLILDYQYRFRSILCVGLGLDSPANCPPAFGSMADAYTIRNYWGVFWHQFLRKPFTSASSFITRNILGLPRPSLLERYTNIFLVFFCSATMHVMIDYVQTIAVQLSGSMPFFLSFVLGIMIEDGVQALWRRLQTSGKIQTSESQVPPRWKRIVGLLWVMAWLGITSTWFLHPHTQLPEPNASVPFHFAERLGLDIVGGILLIGGIVLGWVFEVEV